METNEQNESQEVMEISDEELNVSQSSSNLNQSMESTGSVGTDDNKSSSNSNKKNSTKKKRKLTKTEKELLIKQKNEIKLKKELILKTEKERKANELKEKKDLIERQRIEKLKIKEMEKEKRDKEREEKQRLKDMEREEKMKIKDEKEKERLEKLQQKLQIKEAQNQKRKQLEEEKVREERKWDKSRQLLNRFFTKDETTHKKSVLSDSKSHSNGLFLPFELSANQTIAPIVPECAKRRFDSQSLDTLSANQNSNELYLDLLKKSEYKAFKMNKREKSEPEMEIIDNEDTENNGNRLKRYKIKHLQFHINIRPPYRGTFSKKTSVIKPRNPFKKDVKLFDYEVDSDEEWEEGGPGESLDGSESDGSAKDDYEIDNEFMVPHGYLSPDENDENDEQMNICVNNDIEVIDDKKGEMEAKCRPLLKEQVLMAERNRSFSKSLTPVVIGCVWESRDDNNPKFVETLQQFKRISLQTK